MTAFLSGLPTSLKLLLILTLALLPLGVIALLASLQTARTADSQRRADLRVTVGEQSRKLATELTSDMVVLAQATRLAAGDQLAGDVCARPTAIFSARQFRPVRFAVFGSAANPICPAVGPTIQRPTLDLFAPRPAVRIVDNELEIVIPSSTGVVVGVVRYPLTTLAGFARPSGYPAPSRLTLEQATATLTLVDTLPPISFKRLETASNDVGLGNLMLTMTVASVPFGAAEALLTFLPLIMWASAAAVGFYVVDRVLIRPLKQLRQDVVRYVPGNPVVLSRGAVPAIEIGELRDSFASFADRLSVREHELEAALASQVRLTREVHHRVKNNLQVIASLISLHARGTSARTVADPYSTIQRRVDALAIVHRNHFAELEHSQGIDVRALLGELASNFRASMTAGIAAPPISVASASIMVGQDIAMPLAFLFTELAELSLLANSAAAVGVDVVVIDAAKARLTLQSSAYIDAANVREVTYAARIIDGLARQLRAPLDHDQSSGRYAIDFPILSASTIPV